MTLDEDKVQYKTFYLTLSTPCARKDAYHLPTHLIWVLATQEGPDPPARRHQLLDQMQQLPIQPKVCKLRLVVSVSFLISSWLGFGEFVPARLNI